MREICAKRAEKNALENLKRASVYRGETAFLRILFCYILLRLLGYRIELREGKPIFFENLEASPSSIINFIAILNG